MNEMNKGSEGWKIAVAIILVLGVVAAIALSAMTYKSVTDYVASQNEDASDETKEDDVTIADQYVIKSTTQISDAYKSGDASSLSDKDKETLDMASKVLDEIITDGMTDYEKEKAVYDWMTTKLGQDKGLLTVIPSTTADSDNPYGVLKYGNAVCVGYATTFRMFMQMMDIDCMVVHNTDKYHSWDLVKIDGNWYHTDIYSDAGTGTYSNFNLDDTLMSNNQTWDTSFWPAATSLKYNVAYQNIKEFDNINDLLKQVASGIENREHLMAFKYSGTVDEDLAGKVSGVMSLLDTEMMNNSNTAYLGQYNWAYCSDDDVHFLYVTAYYSDDGAATTTNNLTDDEQTKYTEKIDKIFADVFSATSDTGSSDLSEDAATAAGGDIITDEAATGSNAAVAE